MRISVATLWLLAGYGDDEADYYLDHATHVWFYLDRMYGWVAT